MTDAQLTAALATLGLDERTYPAVALLPLIEVAWADGRIQRAERRLIRQTVERYGMAVRGAWLDRWLEERPPASEFLAARQVLLALLQRAGAASDAPETLEALLDLCHRVAAVAGGLFGLAFTVTASERACIEDIAQNLRLGPMLPSSLVGVWQADRPAPMVPPVGRAPTFHGGAAPTVILEPASSDRAPPTLTMPRFDAEEEPE